MKQYLLLLCLVFAGMSLSAQDVHFSQFNASPLTLNPALTGKLDCSYRGVINYRNQWQSIPAPYVTFSAGVDGSFFERKLRGSSLGVGLLLMNDVAGDGNLSELGINLSTAYHQRIGKGTLLSGGVQFTFTQRGLNTQKLIFTDDIGPNGQITGNGEVLSRPNPSYADVQAGLHLSSVVNRNFSFNIGGAFYHITEPVESFYSNDFENRKEARIVGHGGMSFAVGERVAINPSFQYMQQGTATELNIGSSVGYFLESATVFGGLWHRYQDAMIVLIGLGISDLTFGVSYDISVSDITKANNGRGGFELSLAYNGCVEAKRRIAHCPRF